MTSSDIDLTAAKKIARGKRQKVWLEELLSEDGFRPHDPRHPAHGPFEDTQRFMHRLRLEGYEIWERGRLFRLVGASPESANGYRFTVDVFPEAKYFGLSSTGQTLTSIREIINMGPNAVEIAHALWQGHWHGSLNDLVAAVRTLMPIDGPMSAE